MQDVINSNIFTNIMDDLKKTSGYVQNKEILDIFFSNPPTDVEKEIARDTFLKNLMTLEIGELLNSPDYRIDTYFFLVSLNHSMRKVTNALQRKEKLASLKKHYLSNIRLKEFLPNYNVPNQLEEQRICKNSTNFREFINETFTKFHNLDSVLKVIFDYDSLIKPYRNRILYEMNLQICPYCNNHEIINTEEFSTADVDHFYPKSSFPLLGLSFGNFIPSCKNCNQVFKNQSLNYILNPREKEFGQEANFYISNMPELFLNSTTNFNVKINIQKNNDELHELINESIKLFKLETIYNTKTTHNYVMEKINIVNLFRPIYIDMIEDFSPKKLSVEEVYQKMFSFNPNEKNFLNIQRGKLTSDLFDFSFFYDL